jgi:hypothetical protein
MRRYNESRESETTKYYKRMFRRLIWLVIYAFALYVVVMCIVWAAPKIWHWALG